MDDDILRQRSLPADHLPHQHQLVAVALLYGRELTFPLGVDAPLRVIAVHDQYVAPQCVEQTAMRTGA